MRVIFMMWGGFGLRGGAFYIDDHALRSRQWRTGVSLAGSAMNILLIGFLWLPFGAGWLEQSRSNVAAYSLGFLIQLEISSVLLCLLPVPPLDGFRAVSPWLPEETTERLLAQSSMFLWGLFLILWYVPAANGLFWDVVFGVCDTLGIDPRLGYVGLSEFQFWR